MRKEFADTLAKLRRNSGVSQRNTAEQLGVSQALLSHYENGIREPGLDFVVRAAEYYHVSLDYLLGRTEITINPFTTGELNVRTTKDPRTPELLARLDLAARRTINTVAVLLSLASRAGGEDGVEFAEGYFSAGAYHLFRTIRLSVNAAGFEEDLKLRSDFVSSRCMLASNFALAQLVKLIGSNPDADNFTKEDLRVRYYGSFDSFMTLIKRTDDMLSNFSLNFEEKKSD